MAAAAAAVTAAAAAVTTSCIDQRLRWLSYRWQSQLACSAAPAFTPSIAVGRLLELGFQCSAIVDHGCDAGELV